MATPSTISNQIELEGTKAETRQDVYQLDDVIQSLEQ